MKYVVLHPRENGMTQVVFCVAPLTHAELAGAFAATHKPVSAGFCGFGEDSAVRVYGRSESLKLEPAPGDALLISTMVGATERTAVC
jgi:hypothetical protein